MPALPTFAVTPVIVSVSNDLLTITLMAGPFLTPYLLGLILVPDVR
jgi:hypothetical protein